MKLVGVIKIDCTKTLRGERRVASFTFWMTEEPTHEVASKIGFPYFVLTCRREVKHDDLLSISA